MVKEILQSIELLNMRSVRKLLLELFGPTSRFNIGEGVQLMDGHDLMVVLEIVNDPDLDEPLIHCQWYDSAAKSSRKSFFSEKDLKPFDWYHHEEHNQALEKGGNDDEDRYSG